MGIKIITDSTSYIPVEIKSQYDITEVPLSVILENNSYKETEIDTKFFYRKVETLDSIPTSSQPSVADLYEVFENQIKEGHDVIGIFISSDMSGTYSSANTVIKEMLLEKYPNAKIEMIDSQTNCMQMGYCVIETAKAAQEGNSFEDVVHIANNMIKKSRFLFIPSTLEYLKKGGRIGSAAALLGKVLQIIPILTVENGKTTVYEKVRTKQKAINKMIDKTYEDIKLKGLGQIIIHHINCEEEGRVIANKVKELLNVEILIQDIGPVIGAHVGPGAIGIAYYTQENLR